jgi:hypothetical protein
MGADMVPETSINFNQLTQQTPENILSTSAALKASGSVKREEYLD